MLSDIEIAQQNKMEKIQVIADKCGLTPDDIEQYGHYKAKISFDAIRRLEAKPDGKLLRLLRQHRQGKVSLQRASASYKAYKKSVKMLSLHYVSHP